MFLDLWQLLQHTDTVTGYMQILLNMLYLSYLNMAPTKPSNFRIENWSVIECPFTYNGHSIIGPYGPIIDDDFLVITDYAE